VTVSALSDEQSGEVGGLQNTFTNLGISIGTALTGAILISVLTASSFISDADLETALKDAGVKDPTAAAIVDDNAQARLDGLRAALSVLAILALIALFLTNSLPTTPVGAEQTDTPKT
jgi:Na+/melibiose symporter-like transporter